MRVLGFFWLLLFIPLSPLLWLQGLYARLRTPRLPEARGACEGFVRRDGLTLSLVVMGESPVAGVGVESYETSLTAQLARFLAEQAGLCVKWHALGENGVNAAAARQKLVPRLAGLRPDLIVIALGVNDTTGLTARARWRAEIGGLVNDLRNRSNAPILFAAVPPVDSFTALPQPLRWVLGLRAGLLRADLRKAVAGMPDVALCPPLPPLTGTQLSADRYHPSAEGCRAWAEELARCAAPLLKPPARLAPRRL